METQSTRSLHDDALAVLSDLRRAMSDLIAHIPGTIRRPMDTATGAGGRLPGLLANLEYREF